MRRYRKMPRSGTLVCCLQNLDFSGANQVVLNIVSGKVHESNVVVLSPKIGSFAAKFVDTGVAVRIGNIDDLLMKIGDVHCIICNTIMTCSTVVEMSRRKHPVIWILHEWWDDAMIVESFALRNIKSLTLDTVKTALKEAAMIVFVCDAQRELYKPTAPSTVIFVGVPDPFGPNSKFGDDTPSRSRSGSSASSRSRSNTNETPNETPTKRSPGSDDRDLEPFTLLCLGIVCPRKNQCWTVEVFKEWVAANPYAKNARLIIVGARYTRDYEISYLEELKALIGDDLDVNIELHDVTTNVDEFFQNADALIITSLNEVTPMVISEAFAWGLPVISTNIAGIKEMYVDGQEGYLLDPGDKEKAILGMDTLFKDRELRSSMSKAARERFESFFDVELMVQHYRQLINQVAPPVVLIDMDGVLVDWDQGFISAWKNRSPVDRSISYYMEKCLDADREDECLQLIHSENFFLNLPPMEGAIQAVKEMEAEGLQVFICTSPLKASMFCAYEKIEWVREHLGEEWIDKIIICQNKTEIRGDLLIDDKPTCATMHSIWRHVVFDAPYNRHLGAHVPRLSKWQDWRSLLGLLGQDISDTNSEGSNISHTQDPDIIRFFHQSKKMWSSFRKKVMKSSALMFSRSTNSSRNELATYIPS